MLLKCLYACSSVVLSFLGFGFGCKHFWVLGLAIKSFGFWVWV